jgi:hypothetical protein
LTPYSYTVKKVKIKFAIGTGHEDPKIEQRHISILSLTSAESDY